MSRDYTEITDEQLRAINKRAVEQPSYEQLREQNRVLDGALRLVLESWVNGRKVRDGIGAAVLVTAQAALTATSQPEPCTNHFSDGSKIFPSRDCCKPATSQEGQHESR